MFLSNASVRRPIAMLSLVIALTLLGINAYRKMGLEMMPHLDLPFITIATVYPGASPEEIEVDVAKRIEDAVVSIDGLKHATSSCMENVCITSLEFQLGVDVDVVATDVREKIDLIRSELPSAVEDPTISKFDVNATAIVTMVLTGDATLAAVLGMIPLAAGQGMGAEIRNGVGIASIGGILASGVLTLLVVPVMRGLVTRRRRA